MLAGTAAGYVTLQVPAEWSTDTTCLRHRRPGKPRKDEAAWKAGVNYGAENRRLSWGPPHTAVGNDKRRFRVLFWAR